MSAGSWLLLQTFRVIADLPPAVQIAAAGAVVALLAVAVLAMQSAGAGESARTAPAECWKMGVFYFNPDDPALFIPKRFGIGYTLNFANPWSWVVLAVTMLPALAVIAWLPFHVAGLIHRGGLRTR